MTLLLFKLFAPPLIIGVAGWATARWGAAAGGWMAGLPLTTGPVSVFLCLEYGPGFAAHAALGALLAMPAIAAYATGYVISARRGHGWFASALISQLCYFAVLALLAPFTVPAWLVFVFCFLALFIGLAAVRLRNRPVLTSLSSGAVVVLRMIVTTALVVAITLVAPHLGPTLSGLASTVLIVAGVLAAASHREHGPTGGNAVIRGMMMGQIAFLAFLTAVWALLPLWGWPAYGIALGLAAVTGFAANHTVARFLPPAASTSDG